jgi:hypothetical protein
VSSGGSIESSGRVRALFERGRNELNEDVEGRIICLKKNELIKDATRCFV